MGSSRTFIQRKLENSIAITMACPDSLLIRGLFQDSQKQGVNRNEANKCDNRVLFGPFISVLSSVFRLISTSEAVEAVAVLVFN